MNSSAGRRVFRFAAYLGAGLLGLILLVAAAAVFVGGTESGRAWLAATIVDQISVPGETQVGLSRLEGPLPGVIVLQDLDVADRDGTWLTIDRVTLDWNPLRLFLGEFSVDLLEADGVTVVRAPVPGEPSATPAEPFQWPALPIGVSIEKFLASPVVLGEAVLGKAATIRAEGEARIGDGGRTVTRLAVTRLDGPKSRLVLDAAYDPGTDILAVEAQAEEPEGGLIATAAGFSPPLPLAVTFSGEGPLDDWAGTLRGTIGDRAELTADIGISRPDGQMALRIASSLRAPDLMPPDMQPLARDGVQFLFEGRTTGETTVRIDTLSVTTSALAATVAADLDIEAQTVEGTAEVVVTDGTALDVLTAPAKTVGARLDATFVGPMLKPVIEITARADSVALPQAVLRDLSFDLVLKPERPIDQGPIQASFETRGRVAEIVSDSLSAEKLAAPLTFEGEGRVDLAAGSANLSSFELATPTMTASASFEADLETLASHGTARLEAKDLAALSPFVGAPVMGAADLEADFTVADDLRSIKASLRGQLRKVDAEGLPLSAIFGDLTTIDGAVSTDSEGMKNAWFELQAKAGVLTALATLSPDAKTVEGDYELRVPDLAAVAAAFGVPASGDLTLSGTVTGDVADPTAMASLSVASVRLSGQALGTVRAEAKVETAVSAPRGRFEISASPRQGAVGVTTSFGVVEQVLRFDPLRITAAGSRVDGAISVPMDGGPATGKLAGDLDKLGPLMALAGIEGSGSGRLDIRFSGKKNVQAADAKIAIRNIVIESAEGGAPVEVDGATADARITLGPSLGGTVTLNAEGIRAGMTEVDSLSFMGSGNAEKADISLDAKGKSFAPFTLATTGSVSAVGKGVSLSLSRFDATLQREKISLASPATLSWQPGDIKVSDLDLRVAGGRITADAAIARNRFSGDVEIQKLPLSLARLVVPDQDIGGMVSGHINLAGSMREPTASVRIHFSDVRTSAAETVPLVDVVLDADWRNAEVKAQLALSGFSDQPLTSSMTFPLRLDSETMTPVVPPDGPLSGTIRWSGAIGPLFLLTSLDDQRLTGMAEIALDVDGTVSKPMLAGFVSLSDGSYEHLVAGTIVRSLNLRVDAEGRRLVLSSLSATDGGAGRISGSGAISLDQPTQGVEFAIAANNFIVVRRDDVTAATDADLKLAKIADGTRLSGKITVREAEIRLVNQLPPSVVTLGVVEQDGDSGELATSTTAETTLKTPDAGPESLEIDLRVSMPERVFVRGRGLESEWSGDFRISGTADSPKILGELSSIRGRLSLLTKEFDLQPSRIQIAQGNSGEIILTLNIRTRTEANDLTVVVTLTGTAANPAIKLTSTPELPQDEILSRLLFGRSSARLSTIEAVQLAAAVRDLTGDGSPGILDMGRRFLGVDVLRVDGGGSEGDDAGGATVQAGKYIADGVFVGVEQGTLANSQGATVEIEVIPHVSVTSKVGQSGDSNVGVKVEWDY